MRNNWNFFIVGRGAIDAANDLLATFVSKLRDLEITVTNVMVNEGEYHPDLADTPSTSETGWTLYAYGDGDITPAYEMLPGLLEEFSDAGIEVVNSGILVGELRELVEA